MEKIEMPAATNADNFEKVITTARDGKKKAIKDFMNNAGIFMGILIMIAVVVLVTTDIEIGSFADFASLGLNFFLLLFCTYSMYLSCSDSGMRHGRNTESYKMMLENFKIKKASLLEVMNHDNLCEFCRFYVEKELKETRKEALALAGLSYGDYEERWLGMDEEKINAESVLSKNQKHAVIHANRIKPIRLTPEMILARGRGTSHRTPLGKAPEDKKRKAFGLKFIMTLGKTIPVSVITISIVQKPTWTMIAACVIKLLVVVMNGFAGYKLGYENIVVDTENYIDAQMLLMDQAMQYIGKEKGRENLTTF